MRHTGVVVRVVCASAWLAGAVGYWVCGLLVPLQAPLLLQAALAYTERDRPEERLVEHYTGRAGQTPKVANALALALHALQFSFAGLYVPFHGPAARWVGVALAALCALTYVPLCLGSGRPGFFTTLLAWQAAAAFAPRPARLWLGAYLAVGVNHGLGGLVVLAGALAKAPARAWDLVYFGMHSLATLAVLLTLGLLEGAERNGAERNGWFAAVVGGAGAAGLAHCVYRDYRAYRELAWAEEVYVYTPA